ncbi:pseudouridine synthase [Melampsora americana]|nr:pseudouridine synthase [Melampsora americana]
MNTTVSLQPAFLWVLTEPGTMVTLDEFHDWYDNEHVPLRMSKMPEFLTGARYVAIDGKQPSFSAFYNISISDLFNQSKYTDLRKYRSPREAEIFTRIGALDRRAYQVIETECHITDTRYSPVVITVEYPDLDDGFTNLQKMLKTHPSCKGSQTCKIMDHSLVGAYDSQCYTSTIFLSCAAQDLCKRVVGNPFQKLISSTCLQMFYSSGSSTISSKINLRIHNLIRPASIILRMAEPGPCTEPASDRLVRFETPLSGLFAINKPSGMVSMTLLNSLQSLFCRSPLFNADYEAYSNDRGTSKFKNKRGKGRRKPLVKMGQGGTLDPLASGVLVVGLNSATKKLSAFLDCTKSYQTIGLLGCETDSYDRMGKVVRLVGWEGVKPTDIEAQCKAMQGPGWQIPPIYSALKMDGKPLYEYARKNIPLPRPIEARRCEIPEIKMVKWQVGGSHAYKWPIEFITSEDQEMFDKLRAMIAEKGVAKPQLADPTNPVASPPPVPAKRVHSPDLVDDESGLMGTKKVKANDTSAQPPMDPPLDHALPDTPSEIFNNKPVSMDDNGLSPAFTLEMTVTSGTYVRTIVHDIGKAVSSAATVVSLTRTRQGEFALQADQELHPGTNGLGCIEWDVFERAIQAERDGAIEARSEEDGLLEWERELLKRIKR